MQAIVDEIYRIESEEAKLKGEPLPKKRSVSTISRELKRNRTKTGRYNPGLAHEMAMERRERIIRTTSLPPGVLAKAMKLLEKQWSPEQISGYLKLEGIHISKERIYQEIRKNLSKYQRYTHHGIKYHRHKEKQYKTAGKSLIPD